MVGKQPGIIKWQSNSAVFATTDYSNKCMKKGMERILPGSVSGRGTMEQRGVTHAHKHSGTEGCAFGPFNFHQDLQKQIFSCSNRQYGSSNILIKNRRHHQSGKIKSRKKIGPFCCRKRSQVQKSICRVLST